MSRTIIINDDGTAFIQNGNKKTEPVIVKLWTIKDIKSISQEYGYDLTTNKAKKLLTTITKELTADSDADINALLAAFNAANVSKTDPVENALAKMNMKYVECRDCEHYECETNCCGHYGKKASPYRDASDCGHFYPSNRIVSLEYKLDEDNRCSLELPVIYTGDDRDIGKVCTSKNALALVELLRGTDLVDDIEETYFEVEDDEDPSKWNIVI